MQKRLLVGGSLAMVGMLILVLCAILGFLRFQYIYVVLPAALLSWLNSLFYTRVIDPFYDIALREVLIKIIQIEVLRVLYQIILCSVAYGVGYFTQSILEYFNFI